MKHLLTGIIGGAVGGAIGVVAGISLAGKATEHQKDTIGAEDISFKSREEAEEVLKQMTDMCNELGSVSRVNLCDLLGLDSEFSDHCYGWTDLSGASIVKSGNGYSLKLPRAKNFHED